MQYCGGENTFVNHRMRYAQKVRLAIALLIELVALVVTEIGRASCRERVYVLV